MKWNKTMQTKWLILFAALTASLLASPAKAYDVVAVDAVSRQYLLLNHVPSVVYPDAVSRSVLLLADVPWISHPDAVSREILLVDSPIEMVYDNVSSREVLMFLPPYTTPDVQRALQIAGGIYLAAQADIDRLNIERTGTSTAQVDLIDAVRIVRMATGLDP